MVCVLRSGFADGVCVSQAEQEERRKLEAEVRKLRQAGGPLARGQETLSGGVANGAGSRAATPTPAPVQ